MKRCKHYVAGRYKRYEFDKVSGRSVVTHRCFGCSNQLPIGPSNDEPESVQVEIRAAELSLGRDTLNVCKGCEACGWFAHRESDTYAPGIICRSERHRRGFCAGYLAREIAMHDTEEV